MQALYGAERLIVLNSNVPQKIVFGWTDRAVFIGYPEFVDGSV